MCQNDRLSHTHTHIHTAEHKYAEDNGMVLYYMVKYMYNICCDQEHDECAHIKTDTAPTHTADTHSALTAAYKIAHIQLYNINMHINDYMCAQ